MPLQPARNKKTPFSVFTSLLYEGYAFDKTGSISSIPTDQDRFSYFS